ncbi:hypothetical protein FGADI_7885 [Fusarium gaditjirri]|uniref:Uncharacterized protein n=1 Tax=Fusarium gaditjirri TaxID=282569 RepID=A0A8H4T3X3_9HYPO|nr:hypothetical protein FGADI_7885 [Fusarium gaditjirri]
MVGGNPQHDAYGFRYWSNPDSFAEHITYGDLGRLQGFLGPLLITAFTFVGSGLEKPLIGAFEEVPVGF